MLTRRAFNTATLGLAAAANLPLASIASAAEVKGVTATEIKFGATLPMTGPIADVGLASLHGGMAFFNDLNAKGGIHGRKITWVVEDDAFQPALAVSGVRKLVESEEVFGLFSSSGTNSSLAVLPYVKAKKVLWLFPYAGAKQFTSPVSPYVFGLFPSYELQVADIVNHVLKSGKTERIAFVYVNTLDNKTGVDAGIATLKQHGMAPVASVSYEKGTSDFSSTILALQDAKPDCVVESTTLTDFARLIQEGGARQFTPQWAGTATAVDPLLVRLIGRQANGVLGTSPTVPPQTDSPAVDEFRASLHRSYPDDIPSAFNMYIYAAAKILAHALDQTGPNLTQDGLVATLESLHGYDTGLMAPVSYSKDNHLASDQLMIVEIKDGQLVSASPWAGPTG